MSNVVAKTARQVNSNRYRLWTVERGDSGWHLYAEESYKDNWDSPSLLGYWSSENEAVVALRKAVAEFDSLNRYRVL